MSRSSIEWTDRVWNPVTGCSEVSPGCGNCYARKQSERLKRMGSPKYSRGFEVVEHESALDLPLTWNRPSRVFVNSMSDLFHDEVSDEFIERVFAVMALCGHHVFQVLTKRPQRMRRYVLDVGLGKAGGQIQRVADSTYEISGSPLDRVEDFIIPWPLPNVWLGVSVEDQRRADERIPILLRTPAAVRWISAEPLLAPVRLWGLPSIYSPARADALAGTHHYAGDSMGGYASLDWVVAGGESGPRARPMDAEWVRSLRDHCVRCDVPFFFKQWGGVNKKRAGRVLDGRTWDEMPPMPARSGGRG